MSNGWGTQQWGLDEWGGLEANLTVVRAYAISTNELVVVLSKPPMNVSGFVSGDVSNGGSWEVSIPSTNEVLQVAGIAPHQLPLQWVIRTLQRFPDTTKKVRVKATGLRDAGGNVVQLPNYADLDGVTEVVSPLTPPALTRRPRAKDLANVQAPVIDETAIGGTLTVKGGDYSLQDGPALYKKLILRRLVSRPGDFYHLPNYGAGLRVKEPIVGGLVGQRALVEREVSRERDLTQVKVGLIQDQNTVTVTVSAVVSTTGARVTTTLQAR